MRLTSLSLVTSAVLLSATLAQAAGHETAPMEAPAPVSEEIMTTSDAAATGTYIVLGILAALLIAAASSDGDSQLQKR
mgnify:CR=1 FL=1